MRKKVQGGHDRPRLALTFTNKHIYAQCINDHQGFTVLSLSTHSKNFEDGLSLRSNRESAVLLAKSFGEKALAKGISKVVFDRRGRKYHGCVKAFADTAREVGLVF